MALVTDIGHLLIPVTDMGKALSFYRELLGFRVVGEVNPVWTIVEAPGGRLTLYAEEKLPRLSLGPKGEGTVISLHVQNFEEAADLLESKGVRVKRDGVSDGVVWDPFGNVIGLHDHRT